MDPSIIDSNSFLIFKVQLYNVKLINFRSLDHTQCIPLLLLYIDSFIETTWDCLHDAAFGHCTFDCCPSAWCDCSFRYLGNALGSKDACILAIAISFGMEVVW